MGCKMNTYEREIIGNIVIVKNIIFKNIVINKNELDHSYKYGRPCIIIYSDEEYDYLLTLTSQNKGNQSNYLKLEEEDLLPITFHRFYKEDVRKKQLHKMTLKGYINLENIYKMPISGHDEVGKVTFESFKNIISKLKKYHQKDSLEEIIANAKNIRGR